MKKSIIQIVVYAIYGFVCYFLGGCLAIGDNSRSAFLLDSTGKSNSVSER